MAKEHFKKTLTDGTLGDESVVPKRRTRTKVDVTKLHPLDAKLHRMAQAHRIIKMADGLDEETLELVTNELLKVADARRDKKEAAE